MTVKACSSSPIHCGIWHTNQSDLGQTTLKQTILLFFGVLIEVLGGLCRNQDRKQPCRPASQNLASKPKGPRKDTKREGRKGSVDDGPKAPLYNIIGRLYKWLNIDVTCFTLASGSASRSLKNLFPALEHLEHKGLIHL